MPADGTCLGIDLGGTEIKAAIVRRDGEVIGSRDVATLGREGREAVLGRMVELVRWASDVSGVPLAVGIALPGVVDMETGTVELLTNLTTDWHGFGLRDEMRARTGLPVTILNDVRAATLAEHLWGAGAAYTDFLCIAIGTGIGGGMVLDGRLFMGSRGVGGEVGHMTVVPDGPRCSCGNHGCLEIMSSGPALMGAARLAIEQGDSELSRLAGSTAPTPKDIALAAARGSDGAVRVFNDAGRYIGQAAGSLICFLNPQAVIIGGGVASAGDLLLDPIRAEIRRRTIVFSPERGGVDVLPARLGSMAGAIGAAAWAMQHVAEVAR